MFDLIGGLPLHPLVVHAVVVLIPLAVLGAIATILVPRWRRYLPVVAVVATLAALALPVATQSGEALERRVGEPGVHAALGGQLLWLGLALAAVLWVLVLVDRYRRRAGRRGRGVAATAVAALTVVLALATGVQVYRVGDTGARAVWADQVGSSAVHGDGD
ncbi:putative membrane protein [Georgenia soli]|uniref:Putative membrane protein n=1 Tax=Georgenia soli TaxID=638953 RepID=A0A2A9EK19_9MICO|nr:DUF2231 domain-containing protein [Georgenia soli]PFG38595.1 putative membrane protein [Georgenia soli]